MILFDEVAFNLSGIDPSRRSKFKKANTSYNLVAPISATLSGYVLFSSKSLIPPLIPLQRAHLPPGKKAF